MPFQGGETRPYKVSEIVVMPLTTTVRVPFVDIAGQHRAIKDELLEAISEVLDSGAFVLGEPVRDFEDRFADLCGTRFAVAVNSGTDALVLALRALGIGLCDEVITVPNSFIATASAIVQSGARPVFVDVGDDYNMDPALIEAAITPRTRAILPVHLTGRTADMSAIRAVADRHGLPIVEDAAQAVMAECHGRRAGALGTLGCFSLHPLKTLNACGDGGVITTDDAALAEKLRILRNLGLRTRDECVAWSGNSRLDSLQAAILLVKLRYVADWTEARRTNAAFYRRELADVSGLSLPMAERAHEYAVYHTFIIQTPQRDALRQFLAGRGIETNVHYPVPTHRQPAAAELGLPSGSFPVAERQATRFLSLPVHQGLTSEQRQAVVDGVREFFDGECDGSK
jgi:dTDP-4-amino-4,6-dideoxygalactose transaminase